MVVSRNDICAMPMDAYAKSSGLAYQMVAHQVWWPCCVRRRCGGGLDGRQQFFVHLLGRGGVPGRLLCIRRGKMQQQRRRQRLQQLGEVLGLTGSLVSLVRQADLPTLFCAAAKHGAETRLQRKRRSTSAPVKA